MSTEENKATFRRYVEEVSNRGNFELADEIFDRYVAHQPDGRCWSAAPRMSNGSSAEGGPERPNLQ